jgi:hypothetical protein
LNELNSKTLAFLISIYGKTSLFDNIVIALRDKIYEQFCVGKANIFDIVETFNTLMTLNHLSAEDLEKIGLDKVIDWAHQISTEPKNIQ